MNTNCILLIGCGVLSVALFFIWMMARLYDHRTIPAIQTYLEAVLYAIDKECDELETPFKKQEAVREILELIGWRRILVPGPLVGLSLSILVWLIRSTRVPDLHKTEQTDAPKREGMKCD